MHGTAAVHDLSPGFRGFWAVCLADTGCRPWGRNASENPAGIETMQFVKEKVANEKEVGGGGLGNVIIQFCVIDVQ